MSLFRKSHNAICGGYGAYTSQEPCKICGSQLFSYKIGGCKSCHDREENKKKFAGQSDAFKNRLLIDATLERIRLEKENRAYYD